MEMGVRSRPLPLSALRTFEVVARLSSVSKAAEEIGRTHGAVSKQIKALQIAVGAPLFDRVGTRLRPNARGLKLAKIVNASLDQLAEGYDAIVRETDAPAVNVACSASFAMGWLVPQLPKFSRTYPDIAIRLSMTSAREMREDSEADLVILWDRSAYPPFDQGRAIRLGESRFGVVSAPSYPVKRDGEKVISVAQQILHEHTSRAWDQWSHITGIRIKARTQLSFPHTHLCLGAAAAGMGVAIAEERLSVAEMSAGRLINLTRFTPFPNGFAAIPHRSRPMTKASQHFIAWLSDELRIS